RYTTVRSAYPAPANVHDSKVLPELLHGNEKRVCGDSAYVGRREAIRSKAPNARAFFNKRAYRNRPLTETDKETNRRKSGVRAHVEHRFGFIKGFLRFSQGPIPWSGKEYETPERILRACESFHPKNRLLRLATG
ncbi:MAG: transposase, partial [Candidatus Dormibacteria bacterium]